MRLTHATLVLLVGCSSAVRASTLYSIGFDTANGSPTALFMMDNVSAASVSNVAQPLGGGALGFNGGLTSAGGLLYAVGNDSNAVATLYSLALNGAGLTPLAPSLNTSGPATGYVFQNGIVAAAGNVYGLGVGPLGNTTLFQIGAGGATFVTSLQTGLLGGSPSSGTYSGLAYDPNIDAFYSILVNGIVNGTTSDYLVRIDTNGAVTSLLDLSLAGSTPYGTHLGGLASAGSGLFYDLYTNPGTQSGEFEQIDLSNFSASTLYDTSIVLAENHGLTLAGVPEPGSLSLTLTGAGVLIWRLRRLSLSMN